MNFGDSMWGVRREKLGYGFIYCVQSILFISLTIDYSLLTFASSFHSSLFTFYEKEIPPQVTGLHSNRQSNRRDQVYIVPP